MIAYFWSSGDNQAGKSRDEFSGFGQVSLLFWIVGEATLDRGSGEEVNSNSGDDLYRCHIGNIAAEFVEGFGIHQAPNFSR